MVPLPPPPPPHVQANPQLFRNPYKANSDILIAAKAALKAVPVETAPVKAAAVDQGDQGAVKEDQGAGKEDQGAAKEEHSYALADPPSPAMEVAVDSAGTSSPAMEVSLLVNSSSEGFQISQAKKAKVSAAVTQVDTVISCSPVLYHKLPMRSNHQESEFSEDIENSEEDGVKSNLFGVKYMMWFEIGIEGKDSMDQDEEDWGGKIEFGFRNEKFPKDLEDYFILFEDECTQSHACAGIWGCPHQ